MPSHHRTAAAQRLLVISDIHGHSEGLELLLRQAAYQPNQDRLILLGDYIDAAAPATWGTLDVVRRLVQQGAVALPGNQELKLLAPAADAQLAAPEQWVRPWLQSLPLYLTEQHYLFVHAGIRPGIPLELQSAFDMTEIREPFLQTPHGLNRTVIFGHTPTSKLGCTPGDLWFGELRIGMDTGAKHGHRLTLLDLLAMRSYSCSTAPAALYQDLIVRDLHTNQARRAY